MAVDKPPQSPPSSGASRPAATPKQAPSGASQPAAAQKPAVKLGAPAPATGATRPGIPLRGQNPQRPQQVPSSRVTLSKGRTKVGVSFKSQDKIEEERKEVEQKLVQVPIEERVFEIPGMKEVAESPLFTDFHEKIAPKIKLAETSWTILEAFSNIDVTAEKVSQAIKGNPYYEYLFQKVIEGMAKREEMPSIEGSIVLLGMQNFRNLIIALQASRSVMGTHAEWDKDGKLKIAPNDVLKYAVKTEEILINSKSEYSDTAYAAGLLFDVLGMIAGVVCQDKKRAAAFLDTVYAHGLRSAQIALEMAKLLPDFGFKKYVFSSCLIHDIGKICLAILNPDYITFCEDAKKKEWPRPVRQFAELEKFGIDHSVIGNQVCYLFKIFRPLEKVVLFHHSPHLLKSRNANLFQIACIVDLATNIANNFKKIEKLDDPILSTWKGLELRDFRIEFKTLADAVAKVQI